MDSDRPACSATPDPLGAFPIDRRDFIRFIGAGITVFLTFEECGELAAQQPTDRGYPADFNAYLNIAADGKVTIYSGKIEMGQGVVTSLAQMAADELGVPLESIHMVMGDTETCPADMGTFGSLSTRFFGPALRSAAAAARSVLLDLASERLNTPRDRLTAEDGVVFVGSDRNSRVSYGQLAMGQRITRKLDGRAPTKELSQFKLMGKATRRIDARAKVTGKAQYAGDIRLPDMLYARILHPPALGASLKAIDTSEAEKQPGVIVIRENDLVAVLHRDPEAAAQALGLIRAEFDVPAPTTDTDTIFDHLVKAAPPGVERERRGDLAEGRRASSSVFEREYLNGYVAHASMETHTALARIEGGRATLWISTQTPFPNQQEIARAIGFPVENVRVITPFVGGGFGGKSGGARQAVEAARLAKASGKPVQVAWTRAEEFLYDSFRPAAVVKLKSGMDSAGRLSLWDYSVYLAGSRGSEQFYDVPNNLIRVFGEWRGEAAKVHPLGIGPWRAPAANTNCFARESQIDIMAAAAKVDPLEFRLKNLTDQRMRRVLQTAAQRFGWKGTAGPSGGGFGIACGIDAGTYVAACAEVKVDRQTGNVQVRRVVCAQDMGIVINPDGATMQMEGCVMMGLGYVLSEEVRFKGGQVQDRNFDTYELPRFSWLPEVETILVKNDEVSPQGGGEPVIILMGALIANAVFDAVGARLFRLPMTPVRVKEALGASLA